MKPYHEHGGITIYHGDCCQVLPCIQGSWVVVTDPPFGLKHSSNREGPLRGVAVRHDGDTELRDWVLQRPEVAAAAVFGSWKRPRPAGTRAVLVWDKGPASGMGDLSFPWKLSWEEIYILGDGWIGHRDEGVLKGYGIVTWSSRGRDHPTEKPSDLLAHIIGKAPPGMLIDPFAGTGSTLRAAKNLGRSAIGIEIEERYCEIAARRLEQEVLDFGGAA